MLMTFFDLKIIWLITWSEKHDYVHKNILPRKFRDLSKKSREFRQDKSYLLHHDYTPNLNDLAVRGRVEQSPPFNILLHVTSFYQMKGVIQDFKAWKPSRWPKRELKDIPVHTNIADWERKVHYLKRDHFEGNYVDSCLELKWKICDTNPDTFKITYTCINYNIIIIMSRCQHESPWPSLTTCLY